MSSRVLRLLLLTPLAMLALGLAGYGAVLLTGPYLTDPTVTSGGWFFLFVAGGLVVLTVAMLRGNYTAWVLTGLLTGVVVLLPVAWWVSSLAESLSEVERPNTVKMTASATAPASAATWLGDFSLSLVMVGAVWGCVMLLLPATRTALGIRRAR